jgi:hypothetical protein
LPTQRNGYYQKKTFDRFSTKDGHTWNVTRKILQCETGSLSGVDLSWFKGRRAGEKGPVTGDNNNNIMIITINS